MPQTRARVGEHAGKGAATEGRARAWRAQRGAVTPDTERDQWPQARWPREAERTRGLSRPCGRPGAATGPEKERAEHGEAPPFNFLLRLKRCGSRLPRK